MRDRPQWALTVKTGLFAGLMFAFSCVGKKFVKIYFAFLVSAVLAVFPNGIFAIDQTRVKMQKLGRREHVPFSSNRIGGDVSYL